MRNAAQQQPERGLLLSVTVEDMRSLCTTYQRSAERARRSIDAERWRDADAQVRKMGSCLQTLYTMSSVLGELMGIDVSMNDQLRASAHEFVQEAVRGLRQFADEDDDDGDDADEG